MMVFFPTTIFECDDSAARTSSSQTKGTGFRGAFSTRVSAGFDSSCLKDCRGGATGSGAVPVGAAATARTSAAPTERLPNHWSTTFSITTRFGDVITDDFTAGEGATTSRTPYAMRFKLMRC